MTQEDANLVIGKVNHDYRHFGGKTLFTLGRWAVVLSSSSFSRSMGKTQGAIEIIPKPTLICHLLPRLTFARLGGDIASMLDADATGSVGVAEAPALPYGLRLQDVIWPLLSLMYTLRVGNRFPPPVMVKEKGQT
ncbi:hypothetical protein BGW80DRAFT_1255390 [Lactifluus volemus]|nr:hypothetical protein BGW80DRAFT_1255390 [Lactifluus volemus]